MADYVQTTFFGPKDSLSPGDPLKVIQGSAYDTEYAALSTAIGTKVDQVGVGIGLSGKIVSLSFASMSAQSGLAPSTDLLALYDASAAGHVKVTIADLVDSWAATRTITAGLGITGTGTLDGDLTLAIDISELSAVTIVGADSIPFYDASGATQGRTTLTNFVTAINPLLTLSTLIGYVANEHINHTSVSISAGTGLTGGGTIASTRTLNLDISGLTAMTATPVGTDSFLYNDGGTMKQMSYNQLALPARDVSSSGNFASTDVGTIVYWTGATGTLTMVTGVGQDDSAIVVINSGSGNLTIAGSGVTITSANSLVVLPPGGVGALIRETNTVWFLGGNAQ